MSACSWFYPFCSRKSHVVDELGSPSASGNVIFQFCDIEDLDLKKILESKGSFSSSFSAVCGWWKPDIKARLLGLLKLKWRDELKDHPLRTGGGSLRLSGHPKHPFDSRSTGEEPHQQRHLDDDSYSIFEEDDAFHLANDPAYAQDDELDDGDSVYEDD